MDDFLRLAGTTYLPPGLSVGSVVDLHRLGAVDRAEGQEESVQGCFVLREFNFAFSSRFFADGLDPFSPRTHRLSTTLLW